MLTAVIAYRLRHSSFLLSTEALIEDIEMDKKVTLNSLARPLYQDYARDPFLGR